MVLRADEEMRRRKIVHHWDRNKNIHVWMQTEIHRLQLQELEFAETEARVAIEMEDPVEYNIISQWQARDYKRCKQRDEAAQVTRALEWSEVIGGRSAPQQKALGRAYE